jgi:pantoate--beta-alanine ligase
MILARSTKELKELLHTGSKHPLGFVPTMGALHQGHISLVSAALEECPSVVVSIFVNPTQFNDKKDLENYPRTINADLAILGTVLREKDLVFTPEVGDIYPEEDKRVFSFGNLDMVMEALHRPGHFNGVAQVVSRLFEIVSPDLAYFGLKDLQQLAVIKELVRQTGSRIKVKGMPIIREPDGLAMSSRNMLLDTYSRENAPAIYRTLSEVSEKLKTHDIKETREFVINKISSLRDFNVEYFEIADEERLMPVRSKAELIPGMTYYGCIAVRAGKIRLIDNIRIQL